jgi:Lon protease-like protein
MFPLGSVVLPGGPLPLHIFEPRYRQLVADLLASDRPTMEFGTIMIERGREVGGGEQRANVGTLVSIVDVQVSDDGRYGVMAVGTERLRVVEWLPDDPYPLAMVERWPDQPNAVGVRSVSEATIDRLREQVERCYALARELGEQIPDRLPMSSVDPEEALYELASWSPTTVADRYAVLAAPSLPTRAEVLAAALDDAEAVLKFRGS